jgi:integrase
MFTSLRTMFTFLLERRRVKANPCLGVASPEAPKARDRVLTDDEVVCFWAATETLSKPFCQTLRVLLLTGARLNEVASMKRDELSTDGLTWHLPAERSKNGLAHTVPLAPMVREILSKVDKIAGSDFVFTSTGKVPVAGFGKIKPQLDAAMKGVPHWRLHDLRRTCVTGMAELGIRPDVIELAVNHRSGSSRRGVAGIYNRSELLPERKVALERWAAHVERLVSGRPADKVVPLGRRGKR